MGRTEPNHWDSTLWDPCFHARNTITKQAPTHRSTHSSHGSCFVGRRDLCAALSTMPDSDYLLSIPGNATRADNAATAVADTTVGKFPATVPHTDPSPAPIQSAMQASPTRSPAASPHAVPDEENDRQQHQQQEEQQPGIIPAAAPHEVHDEDEFALADGYETASSGSTSVTSSVYAHTYENGRRYQHFKNGRYPIPNDDEELNREDMKHAMLMELCDGELFYAPIGDKVQNILDIGTGTGE